MADYIVVIKSAIALTGGRAFLCLLVLKRRFEMNESIRNDDQLSRTYRNIDNVLAIKRERLSEGNKIPDTFEYDGRVLDTDKLIEGLLMVYTRDIAKLDSEQ